MQQLVDGDAAIEPSERDRLRLPPRFQIQAQSCSHKPIARCAARDGVWDETAIIDDSIVVGGERARLWRFLAHRDAKARTEREVTRADSDYLASELQSPTRIYAGIQLVNALFFVNRARGRIGQERYFKLLERYAVHPFQLPRNEAALYLAIWIRQQAACTWDRRVPIERARALGLETGTLEFVEDTLQRVREGR